MDELFAHIKESNKMKILQFLEANTITFKKNNVILSNLRQENMICIVLEGYLQIVKNHYDGSRTIIEELKENDIFGTMTSYLQHSEYIVITKEDSKVIVIDFKNIINIDETKPYFIEFLKNLLSIMSKRIQEINDRMEILTNNSIRNKLLAYFKITSKKNKSNVLYLPFNYTDLADYLVVNRSSMSRELKNLKEEGFIEIKGKKIKLLYNVEVEKKERS